MRTAGTVTAAVLLCLAAAPVVESSPTYSLQVIYRATTDGCVVPIPDRFTLRTPTRLGTIIAKGRSTHYADCRWTLTFSPIAASLKRFVVSDDTSKRAWGPFTARSAASRHWLLRLAWN
jgi:hypothetical protein